MVTAKKQSEIPTVFCVYKAKKGKKPPPNAVEQQRWLENSRNQTKLKAKAKKQKWNKEEDFE